MKTIDEAMQFLRTTRHDATTSTALGILFDEFFKNRDEISALKKQAEFFIAENERIIEQFYGRHD